MRFLKSVLIGVIAGGSMFLLLKLVETTFPVATTQKTAATKSAAPKVQKAEPAPYWPEPTTVNLPGGQNFIYVADGRSFGYDGRLYVTRGRMSCLNRITFWKPGGHPGAWEPFLYIQEH